MGHLEVTRLLLEHTKPADVNLEVSCEATAPSLAVSEGHLGIVDHLLREKALNVAAVDVLGGQLCVKLLEEGTNKLASVSTRTLGRKKVET